MIPLVFTKLPTLSIVLIKMKMQFFALTFLFALCTLLHAGCGGREATVVQPPAETEPVDTSAEAAEAFPEEYGNI